MRILSKRGAGRTPESNTCFAPARIHRRLCERHDLGERQPHRADIVPGWSSRFLGVVLVLAALTASAQGQTSVTLAWDRSAGTNIAGYKLYYGGASRTYTNANNLGNATNATISSLISGKTYYFAATAYDASGAESDYSTEVVYTNQAATLPTIVLNSPVSGASYTAPATIGLAATVTANGHTITQVQFYNGSDAAWYRRHRAIQLFLEQRERRHLHPERKSHL